MQRVHFTNDGIYGEVGKSFDLDLALRIADAIAAVSKKDDAPSGEMYVTFDIRPLSQEVALAVARQLAGHGFSVKLAQSYTPMPALNYALRTHDEATCGIMITGDHRGSDVLGLRIRDHRGSAPHPSTMDEIEGKITSRPAQVSGTYIEADFNTPFFEHARTWAKDEQGSFSGFSGVKLLVDSMYGTATKYAPNLLRSLGVDAVELHSNFSKQKESFHPEVVEPWIDECEYATAQSSVDAGVALDGPANRAVVISPEGDLVSLAKMSVLFLYYLVREQGKKGLVLLPRTSSFILKKAAELFGLEVRYVTKAERWAEEEVLPEGTSIKDVLLAGDGINSLIVPSLDPERDAFVIMVGLAQILAAYKRTLPELLQEVDAVIGDSFYAHKDVRLDIGEFEMFKNLVPGLVCDTYFSEKPTFVSHAEGLYASFTDDAWIYLRPSKTESLVHLYCEAKTKQRRNHLLDCASTLLTKIVQEFSE